LRPFHVADHLHPLARGVLPALRCGIEPGHNSLVRRQEHDLGQGVVLAEELHRLLEQGLRQVGLVGRDFDI
jgi:hypothetical protein